MDFLLFGNMGVALSSCTIAGGLIEVLARERHVRMLGSYRENRPGTLVRSLSSAGCIMFINGLPSGADRVFAPYSVTFKPFQLY